MGAGPLTAAEYAEAAEVFAELCERSSDAQVEALAVIEESNPTLASCVRELIAHDMDDLPVPAGPLGRSGNIVAEQMAGDGRTPVVRLSVPEGTVIAGCVVRRLIGRGATGAVYLADQRSPRRSVALKVLPDCRDQPNLLRRFEVETDLLGRLRHPGVARCHAAGLEDAGGGHVRPWIAMEYVEGTPADRWARDTGASVRARVALVQTVCVAIHHAHQQRVVHRDLKPGNILVSSAGVPTVVDFGVALAMDATPSVRLAEQYLIIGSVGFMSPEQARGEVDFIDARADVHGLGAVLHSLIFGRPPHDVRGLRLAQAVGRVATVPVDPITPSRERGVDSNLAAIIDRAIAFAPEQRYESAAGMAADLEHWLNGKPIAARPPSLGLSVRELVRQHWRGLLASGAAIGLVVLLGAAIAVTHTVTRMNALADATDQATQLLEFVRRAQPGDAPDIELADSGFELAMSTQVDALPEVVRAELRYQFGAYLHEIGDDARAIELMELALPGIDPASTDPARRLTAIELRTELAAALRGVSLEGRSTLDDAARHLADARSMSAELTGRHESTRWAVLLESALLEHDMAQDVGAETRDGRAHLAAAEAWTAQALALTEVEAARVETSVEFAGDRGDAALRGWRQRGYEALQTYGLVVRQQAVNAKTDGDDEGFREGMHRAATLFERAADGFLSVRGPDAAVTLNSRSSAWNARYSVLQRGWKTMPPEALLRESLDAQRAMEPLVATQEALYGGLRKETLASRSILARFVEFEVYARRALVAGGDGEADPDADASLLARTEAALQMRRESMRRAVQVYGAYHEDSMREHVMLCDTLASIGTPEAWQEECERAWARGDAGLGPLHSLTLGALLRVLSARTTVGDASGALATAQLLLDRDDQLKAAGEPGFKAERRAQLESRMEAERDRR